MGGAISLFFISGAFAYWAFAVQNYSELIREKLPGWIKNKTLMLVLAGVAFAFGLLKLL